MRDGGAVPQHPHKVKIVGSNPTPATNFICTISVAVTSLPSKQMSSVRSRYRAPRRDLSAIYLSRKHFLSTEVGSQEDKRV